MLEMSFGAEVVMEVPDLETLLLVVDLEGHWGAFTLDSQVVKHDDQSSVLGVASRLADLLGKILATRWDENKMKKQIVSVREYATSIELSSLEESSRMEKE